MQTRLRKRLARATEEVRKLTQQQERKRLAQDMHDNVAADVSQIALAIQAAAVEMKQTGAASQFAEVTAAVERALQAVDDAVWLTEPKFDSLAGFVSYASCQLGEVLSKAGVSCEWQIMEGMPDRALSPHARHNLYSATREAVRNVTSHARATQVWISINFRNEHLEIQIRDNGCGFELPNTRPNSTSIGSTVQWQGNGVENMQQRLSDLGGSAEISSSLGVGTCVKLRIPMCEKEKK